MDKNENVRGPKILETEVDNETKAVVVEIKNKTKMKNKSKGFSFLMQTLKILLGLYIIGTIVGLNEIIMLKLDPLLASLHESTFMSAKFIPWADVVIGPIRFMIGILSWFMPVLLLSSLFILVLSKLKWISKNELKVFSIILAIVLLLIS